MDETCRLRRGEGYGVCADAVVSKCALTGEPLRENPYGRTLTGEKRGRPPVSRRPPSGIQSCCGSFCIR